MRRVAARPMRGSLVSSALAQIFQRKRTNECQWPVGSARWRTVELANCPVAANRIARWRRGFSARGSVGQWRHTPFPAVAWVSRMLSPAVITMWALWSSRSTVALAIVLA